MKYGFTLIPQGRITYVIPDLIPYLLKSEIVSHRRSDVDDIVRFVYTGQMLLWAVYEEETKKILAFVITENRNYPQKKMLIWQYAAGENVLPEGIDELVHTTMEKFARDTQCDGLESIGRFGWKRAAKEFGYTPFAVCYEKYFE